MQQHHAMTTPATANPPDQRASERFGIALPITMEGFEGETHDLSETGIYFETDSEPAVGATVHMTLQYSMDGHDYRTQCEVEVVRVERVGSKVNIAGRLLSPLVSAQ